MNYLPALLIRGGFVQGKRSFQRSLQSQKDHVVVGDDLVLIKKHKCG